MEIKHVKLGHGMSNMEEYGGSEEKPVFISCWYVDNIATRKPIHILKKEMEEEGWVFKEIDNYEYVAVKCNCSHSNTNEVSKDE